MKNTEELLREKEEFSQAQRDATLKLRLQGEKDVSGFSQKRRWKYFLLDDAILSSLIEQANLLFSIRFQGEQLLGEDHDEAILPACRVVFKKSGDAKAAAKFLAEHSESPSLSTIYDGKNQITCLLTDVCFYKKEFNLFTDVTDDSQKGDEIKILDAEWSYAQRYQECFIASKIKEIKILWNKSNEKNRAEELAQQLNQKRGEFIGDICQSVYESSKKLIVPPAKQVMFKIFSRKKEVQVSCLAGLTP